MTQEKTPLPPAAAVARTMIAEAQRRGWLVPGESVLTAPELAEAEKELFQEEINKTSMALNGFYVANVKDYYPISRDPGFIGKDFDTVVSDERLTSMGFLKSRVNAHNPMMLLDRCIGSDHFSLQPFCITSFSSTPNGVDF